MRLPTTFFSSSRQFHSRLVVGASVIVGALAAATTAGAASSHSSNEPARRDPRIAATRALFADLGGPDQPGCALAVRHEGQTKVRLSRGSANIEQNAPITADSVFDAASVSKQFTAASVQLLAGDGRLALTDDVRSYVPELPDYGHVVTIEQLIHHTGGLGDYARALYAEGNDPADVVTKDQALGAIAAERTLLFEPGTQFSYSNSGYFVLGLIVERVSGAPLTQFAAERIFQPLGMTNTRYVDRHDEVIANRARGYRVAVDGSVRAANSNWEPIGDGAVNTTVNDMLRWADELSTGRMLGADLRAAMTTPGPAPSDVGEQSYASGLYLAQANGYQVLRHAGSWYGSTSDFEVIPELGFAAVALCNIDVISSQLDPANYTYPGRQPAERLADVVDLWTKDTTARRSLRAHECLADAPAGANCATLTVPQRRDGGDGRMIGVETMVLPATNDAVADPVVVLEGGPGNSGIGNAEFWASSALRTNRDVVLVDQRGSGSSTPALICADAQQAQLDSFLTADLARTEVERIVGRVAKCFDDFRSNGIDPDAFNTAESAADVADLAAALDAPAINMYGVSYGTRLALEVARSYSGIVRTSTIDSASPPDAPGVLPSELVSDGDEGFDALFAACDAQAACTGAYGDLHTRLDRLVEQFNAHPQPVAFDGRSGPQTATITGNDAATVLWYLLGNGMTLPQVPAAIDALDNGDTSIIGASLSTISGRASGLALGTQIAVDCADSGAKITQGEGQVLDQSGWQAGVQYFYPGLFCEASGVAAVPDSFREPVTADIPTLVLGGSFDPITARSRSSAAAAYLPNAQFVEIADQSHFVVGSSACAQALHAAFVSNPEQFDTACADKLSPPTFD
jgi:CubicO group peptidase (beta-lactamase class C family)/pimeloyl-ACP methyl ester carboxylesterase